MFPRRREGSRESFQNIPGPKGAPGELQRDWGQGLEGQDTGNGFRLEKGKFGWDLGKEFLTGLEFPEQPLDTLGSLECPRPGVGSNEDKFTHLLTSLENATNLAGVKDKEAGMGCAEKLPHPWECPKPAWSTPGLCKVPLPMAGVALDHLEDPFSTQTLLSVYEKLRRPCPQSLCSSPGAPLGPGMFWKLSLDPSPLQVNTPSSPSLDPWELSGSSPGAAPWIPLDLSPPASCWSKNLSPCARKYPDEILGGVKAVNKMVPENEFKLV
ncbi:hypothetical protein DUI87_13348 [Hirundo rustica rustica]|uniref:Uncharacterized protein n=1 Tax=Hirundo rustica rustica TaxID=333673 RepID=A0A3M0KBG0_HIRRU|nr:hypothetical protein DUI87_13348 [Hirundo rustica rustica]